MSRLLIIDDDPSTLASVARAFRMAGHEAEVSGNPGRALTLIREQQAPGCRHRKYPFASVELPLEGQAGRRISKLNAMMTRKIRRTLRPSVFPNVRGRSDSQNARLEQPPGNE